MDCQHGSNYGNLFIDQMNQGNKLDDKCAWKPIAYTIVIKTLQERFIITVTKAHIQSRFKNWEKYYDIVHPLLQSYNSGSAITWDNSRGRIEVHDKNVWKERFEVNPKIGPYRRKIVVENWEDICVLFSQDRANREGAQTAFEANAEMNVEESINLEESFENDPLTLKDEAQQ
ncbi:hypothetical protein ACH5RR_021554 [Cinchona calisaya]|uniref:Myb/SANT-like domain-containing protein n=1 Tax=Cinchona calisaya TaxID=153742 RepID=A0ABD2ZKV1_9GENT